MVFDIQAALDKLDAAIAAGGAVQRFRFADTEVELRSIAEMQAARAHLAGLLATTSGASTYRLVSTSKGV